MATAVKEQIVKNACMAQAYNPSPSGDAWFGNPKNIRIIEDGIKSLRRGKRTILRNPNELNKFLENL